MRPWAQDGDLVALVSWQSAPAQRGYQPRAHERRFSAPGGAEDGEEARRFELLQQTLYVRIATEEELRVLLVEHLQPAVGAQLGVRFDRHFRPQRQSVHRTDERMERALVIEAAAIVDPCAHA